jgi:NAD(P)-dependent dehydrogenase (short-subunit alcohol dehydrogenase family)
VTDTRLVGKRVIVTGAASGLGRAFVLGLVDLGAHVLAADVDEEGLTETAAVVAGEGRTLSTVVVDVSSAEETRLLADAAQGKLGGLDALVNNAAVVSDLSRRPFDEVDEGEWDRVLAVNAKGPWLCARAVIPLLRAAGGGSIVNLASGVFWSGSAGLVHYVTSKAAVIGLTRVLARELGPEGVRVNAIAPGYIPTAGTTGLTGGIPYDTTATALGRLGEPGDLLGALTFLLSNESAFVTGQTILVDGGRHFH